MYRVLSSLMILIISLPSCHSGAQVDVLKEIGPLSDRKLRVHFELPKRTYLVAEPIFLTSWFENYGTKVEYYCIKDALGFALKDETGQSLKRSGAILEEMRMHQDFVPGVGDGYWHAIKPGTSSPKGTSNILDYYGEGQGGYDFYLKAGAYTITARELPSDTITFRVIWPSSPDDSAAAAMLTHAADSAYLKIGSYEQMYRFFGGFVETYPNSIYTPRALARLLSVSTGETTGYDQVKKQYYVRYMLTKFPDFGFAYWALNDLDISLVPAEEKTAVAAGLRKLKANLEAEDLRKRADELIEELEK